MNWRKDQQLYYFIQSLMGPNVNVRAGEAEISAMRNSKKLNYYYIPLLQNSADKWFVSQEVRGLDLKKEGYVKYRIWSGKQKLLFSSGERRIIYIFMPSIPNTGNLASHKALYSCTSPLISRSRWLRVSPNPSIQYQQMMSRDLSTSSKHPNPGLRLADGKHASRPNRV